MNTKDYYEIYLDLTIDPEPTDLVSPRAKTMWDDLAIKSYIQPPAKRNPPHLS